MKKKNSSKKVRRSASEEKTVYRQAGELIGTIGAHIAMGTTRVIDFVSDEATVVKKAIKKKLAKKAPQKKKAIKKKLAKKAPQKKKAIKKVLSKAANKPVKKTARRKSAKKAGKKKGP
jgi:hypothetical protein